MTERDLDRRLTTLEVEVVKSTETFLDFRKEQREGMNRVMDKLDKIHSDLSDKVQTIDKKTSKHEVILKVISGILVSAGLGSGLMNLFG